MPSRGKSLRLLKWQLPRACAILSTPQQTSEFAHFDKRKLFRVAPSPGWRNWQTQRTQNPPGFGPWGFDPPFRHHILVNFLMTVCHVFKESEFKSQYQALTWA